MYHKFGVEWRDEAECIVATSVGRIDDLAKAFAAGEVEMEDAVRQGREIIAEVPDDLLVKVAEDLAFWRRITLEAARR